MIIAVLRQLASPTHAASFRRDASKHGMLIAQSRVIR
jgi:hypothetical protein